MTEIKKIRAGENMLMTDEQLAAMKKKIEAKLKEIYFEIMPFDKTDDNLTKTPHRIAKMMIYETLNGSFRAKPKCTVFKNVKEIDQIVTIGPMKMRSQCAHHGQPFYGDVYFAYKIDKNLLGASKPERMLDWVSRRPNTQEFLIDTFMNEMETILGHKDIMTVACNIEHCCMTQRGILAHDTKMHNVDIRGIFANNVNAKNEVMQMIQISEQNR